MCALRSYLVAKGATGYSMSRVQVSVLACPSETESKEANMISPFTGKPFKHPKPFRRAIYALYVPSGECLYIGQTLWPKLREKQWRKDPRLAGRKFWLSVLHWAAYPESHKLEGKLIAEYWKKGEATLNRNISGSLSFRVVARKQANKPTGRSKVGKLKL